MSTTLEIGRCPAAASRSCSQSGEGPTFTSLKTRAVKRGQRSGTSTVTLAKSSAVALALGGRVVRPGVGTERGAGHRVDLARDPVDAEAVAAVRGHLDLQHRLGQRDHLGQRRARGERVVEHHDAVVVVADLELVGGEDHPFRGDAAQLRLAQLLAARHPRARQRHRDGLAGADVGGAADDRPRPVLADVDGADPQPVGVGVLDRLGHLADHEVVRAAAARRSRSARPRCRSSPAGRPAPRARRRGRSTPSARSTGPASEAPRHQQVHANCSSIRTSLSKKRRRSGMPWRSIATRSIPRPKAKPCTFSGS